MMKRALLLSLAFAAQTPLDAEAQPAETTDRLAAEVTRIDAEVDCTNSPMTPASFVSAPAPQDAAERLRQVSCTLAALYNAPDRDNYIFTPYRYLQQFGFSDEQINTVARYFPPDFLVVTEDYPDAVAFVAAYDYLDQHAMERTPNQLTIDIDIHEVRRSVGETYFGFNFGNCGGCRGGVFVLPRPDATSLESLETMRFTQAYMREPSYVQDLILLTTFHEFGHPFCATRIEGSPLPFGNNHREACSDIYAITMLAVLRGHVTQAMYDYVQWRKMGSFNSILNRDVGRSNIRETHGTALIVESYLDELDNRNNFPPMLMARISDIPQLLQTRHFTRYNNDNITIASAEAFDLMRRHGLNATSWDQRIIAARQTLHDIDSGVTQPFSNLTRNVIEDYIEGSIFWNAYVTDPQTDLPVGHQP